MAEYTAQMAARQTRSAIKNVERALDRLRECSNHFEDLDEVMRNEVAYAAELTADLEQLIESLDEVYPTKPRRKV